MSGDPMLPAPVQIARRRQDTRDTFTIELEPPAGWSFTPGQFNMLWAFGVGEVPISISGDPGDPRRIVHTVRAVGTVTRAMAAFRRGASLGLRGPFGTGWPMDAAHGSDVVIVAGGIGLAPLRPVLYRVLAERDRYRRVALLYGARTPGDLLYTRELESWRGRFDLDVQVTVDSAARGWSGRVGVVTSLIPRADFDPASAVAMICGPEVMMRFTVRDLRARGVPAQRIWVSLERNMKCGIGHCGHCQIGPVLVCRDGPVFRLDRVEPLLARREV